MAFNTFINTLSCKHLHNFFIFSDWNSTSVKSLLLIPAFLQLLETIILLCLQEFYYSIQLNKLNYTVFVLLSLTYFTYNNDLSVHPCCYKWQDFLLFKVSNIPLYIYISHLFIIHLSILFPLVLYTEVGLLGHLVVLAFSFWETSILFSITSAPICIPTRKVQRFPFLPFLLANTYCILSFG